MTSKTLDALWGLYKPRRVRGKKTEQEMVRQYERYVAPVLGAKRVDKITFQMLEDFHQSMADAPYQANRVLALLRTVLRYAGPDSLEWISNNPAKGVTAFPERKRRRHMRRAEAPKIALALLNKEPHAPEAILFLWLLIFSGARPKEIKAARWRDLDGNTITLDDHKTAEKTGVYERTIVLPVAAMEKLNKLRPERFRRPDDKIIRLARPEYIWETIRVEGGCPDLRVYDLRHTFASYALQQGYNLDQIGEALNHTDPKTTKIYAELTDKNRQRMSLDASIAILADMDVVEYRVIPRELT